MSRGASGHQLHILNANLQRAYGVGLKSSGVLRSLQAATHFDGEADADPYLVRASPVHYSPPVVAVRFESLYRFSCCLFWLHTISRRIASVCMLNLCLRYTGGAQETPWPRHPAFVAEPGGYYPGGQYWIAPHLNGYHPEAYAEGRWASNERELATGGIREIGVRAKGETAWRPVNGAPLSTVRFFPSGVIASSEHKDPAKTAYR